MKEYKLIVAGGRDFDDYELLSREILQLVEDLPEDVGVSIVSGMARGADALGAHFARVNKVKLYEFPADWERYGKTAGFIRNNQMGVFSDMALVFWDGQSRGTKHMIETMNKLGKPYIVRSYTK